MTALIQSSEGKDPWMTTWDDLFENFSQRFQNNERPVSAYDQVAFPKVRVNEEVQVAGKNASLERQIIIT